MFPLKTYDWGQLGVQLHAHCTGTLGTYQELYEMNKS